MRSDERDGGGGLGAVRRNVDKLGTFSYMGMLLTYFGLMQVALFFAKEKPVVRSELGRYDLGAFVVAKFLGEMPVTFWCPCVFLRSGRLPRGAAAIAATKRTTSRRRSWAARPRHPAAAP